MAVERFISLFSQKQLISDASEGSAQCWFCFIKAVNIRVCEKHGEDSFWGWSHIFLAFFSRRSFRLNRADSHLLKVACIVLDTLLAHLQMLAPSSLRATLLGRYHHSLHFTSKMKSELGKRLAQEGAIILIFWGWVNAPYSPFNDLFLSVDNLMRGVSTRQCRTTPMSTLTCALPTRSLPKILDSFPTSPLDIS